MIEDIEVGMNLLECFKNETATISDVQINFDPKYGGKLGIEIRFFKIDDESFKKLFNSLRDRLNKKFNGYT